MPVLKGLTDGIIIFKVFEEICMQGTLCTNFVFMLLILKFILCLLRISLIEFSEGFNNNCYFTHNTWNIIRYGKIIRSKELYKYENNFLNKLQQSPYMVRYILCRIFELILVQIPPNVNMYRNYVKNIVGMLYFVPQKGIKIHYWRIINVLLGNEIESLIYVPLSLLKIIDTQCYSKYMQH